MKRLFKRMAIKVVGIWFTIIAIMLMIINTPMFLYRLIKTRNVRNSFITTMENVGRQCIVINGNIASLKVIVALTDY